MQMFQTSPTPELEYVSLKMEAAGKAMREQGEAFANICQKMLIFVEKEAPSFLPFFQKLVANYNALTNAFRSCSDEMLRASDDLRDIALRAPVVLRLEKELQALRRKYQNSQQKYEAAKRAVDNLVPETISNEKEARTQRLQAAIELRDAFVYFQEYKKKFTRFQYVRTQQAYLRYGKALEMRGSLELPMYNSLIKLLRSIREHVNDPEKILSEFKAPPKPKPDPNAPKGAARRAARKPRLPRKNAKLKRKLAEGDEPPNDDEEIEIEGYMYDVDAKQPIDKEDKVEEEEKRDIWDFSDDGIDTSTPIEQKIPDPKPFEPKIDESKLNIKEVEKEIFK